MERILGTNENWGKWSVIVAVMLPHIVPREIQLENILSIRDFEWLVILVGSNIYGIKELEACESKKWLVGWSLKFRRFILKSPRRKTCFHSLDTD